MGIALEPVFLKIKGGWINPTSIANVQTHKDNPAMLLLGVTGVDRPIPLNETDSAYVAAYLESRTWRAAKSENERAQRPLTAAEPQKEIEE